MMKKGFLKNIYNNTKEKNKTTSNQGATSMSNQSPQSSDATGMEHLRESLNTKLKNFIFDRNREHDTTTTRTVNLKDGEDIKKWLLVDDEDNETEYKKRNEGLLKLYKGSIRESFDYIRWLTIDIEATSSTSSNAAITEVSKHLQETLNIYAEIFDSETGNEFLAGCFDGSLLVEDNKQFEVPNGETCFWTFTGYETSLMVFKMFGQNMPPELKEIANFYQKNRIQSPAGASKISRFSESEQIIQSLGGGMIREARCAVTEIEISCSGISVDGDILALSGSTGYKYRSPSFLVKQLEQNPQNNEMIYDPFQLTELETGFYEPGCFVACSQKLGSVACMADQRIKIFDVNQRGMPCRATLMAKNCSEVVFIDDKILTISNTKSNEIHQWNFQNLKEHEPWTLDEVLGEDEDVINGRRWLNLTESSWNDDVGEFPEKIDVNIGETPHIKSIIQGLPKFEVDTVTNNFASTNHSLLLASSSDPAIYLVDLDQSKVVQKFFGNLNIGRRGMSLSTSMECPNLLMSTLSDNHVRIWDLRSNNNLPVMTIAHAQRDYGSGDISSCFGEDMIIFTGGKDQCIRTWDLRRFPTCMYKLSTGNTSVETLQYSEKTKSLFAVVQGFGCKQYFPPDYFEHEWNNYTQRGTMDMQHRASSSHLITYDFKESLDVNADLPRNRPRADSDCSDY